MGRSSPEFRSSAELLPSSSFGPDPSSPRSIGSEDPPRRIASLFSMLLLLFSPWLPPLPPGPPAPLAASASSFWWLLVCSRRSVSLPRLPVGSIVTFGDACSFARDDRSGVFWLLLLVSLLRSSCGGRKPGGS
uniref:Uncharacterized protein n=1 Tax=Anopheles farauti TaxID=69004 RepID=A0A182Q323_9DIPT